MFQSLSTDKIQQLSSVGYVSDHVEVKVVDENGRIVPFGTQGELCIRSYLNISGYWDDEEKTKQTITSSGWLKTGYYYWYYFKQL